MDTEEQKIVAEYMQAERAMHKMYGSTAVCWGGIGGSAMTMHCIHECQNTGAHLAEEQRYHDALAAMHRLLG